MKNPPRVLGVVFLTVFLDIVGFSVLFPLFPALLDHYLAVEGTASGLGQLTAWLREMAAGDSMAVHALFGGILGSLYGILQFVFSTLWGGMSDRIGRRPVLLTTLAGTVLSYVLWVFAGSFSILIAARILGGAMAGNISTASAAVADTTTPQDRAKGMGMVGMAIGLGFILGPAIGGLSSFFLLPGIESGVAPNSVFALNPFSIPAIASLGLGILNIIWVALKFPETLPPEKRGLGANQRSLNPFARLRTLDAPGILATNLLYLTFLTAFAAAEFSLTFLAAERLDYTPRELTGIFVFVGLIIAIVQGGFVRRLAPKYGERKIATIGLATIVPGLAVIASAQTSGALYAGLAFLAVGSALAMPCLSALVSRYAPVENQGLAMGTFRSMGSLARAFGPLLGAVLYWQLGSQAPYYASAAILLIPIWVTMRLPAPLDSNA